MSEITRFLKNYSLVLAGREAQPISEARYAPPIVISREIGSGGFAIAQTLATRLGFEMCDKRILDEIAAKSHVPPNLVALMDERPSNWMCTFGTGLLRGASLHTEEFDRYLKLTVRSLLKLGSVVILGRGAAFLAKPGQAFRLRLVAPTEIRVANLVERHGISEKEAHAKICNVDRERSQFFKRAFGHTEAEAEHFDVTINTGTIHRDDVVELALNLYFRICTPQEAAIR